MKNVTKLLALLLTLAMLVSVPVGTAAEEVAIGLFPEDVLNSITVEEKTGKGLAFLYEMQVSGAAVNSKNEFVNTDAVAIYEGVEYQVVAMGAVLTNTAEDIARIDELTRADANDNNILDVTAKKLFYIEEDSCAFAVRITNLPSRVTGFGIASRPYAVLSDGEEEITVYGNSDIATYNEVYYKNNPDEIPVWTAGVPELDQKIQITNPAATYVAYDPVTYREAFKVNATLKNTSAANTFPDDYIVCSFKDAEGNVLGTTTLDVDALIPGATKDVEFYVPVGTATIEATELNLHYITLPAIGSDIDVTKKKNRIRVSAATASFNEDGTIHVALTFTNYTSNWITEETDYVQYTYYDAAGTKIKTVTLNIGVIDTKKHPSKTYEFDLPATAASVKITKSKIVYWTEWA